LDKPGYTNLNVFNLLGQKVATLVNEYLTTGTYSYNFDATMLTSGVYIYQLSSGSYYCDKKNVNSEIKI